jgi:nitronate monooxygenase
MSNPQIIQGGMGVAVSGYKLARAVSQAGQLGVVSGTALAGVLARRLQLGDLDGDVRRALAHFPIREMADRLVAEYYIEGGKPPGVPFRPVPMMRIQSRPALVELTVAANFVEVFLAKEGHSGKVGINYLEKIQLPTLSSMYGAMLANVDYVLMGAGIPRHIPGVIDAFAAGNAASLRLDVAGALHGEEYHHSFDPQAFFGGTAPRIPRPLFLGIIASATLALTLAKKANGRVDGFVVEGPTAGGHNAPPRGALQLSPTGEPVYGPRDVPELEKIQAVGLPFWLAGSYGRPSKLTEALALGAAGVQVGTIFAFCEESGMRSDLKRRCLALSRSGKAAVYTDPLASPTGYPFKVARVEGTISEPEVYEARPRVCDLGYLRQLYRKPDGTVGYRCASEPIKTYLRKGGTLEATVGRKCICNGLASTVGLCQTRPGLGDEPAMITAGDDLAILGSFLPPDRESYSAAEAIQYLLGR